LELSDFKTVVLEALATCLQTFVVPQTTLIQNGHFAPGLRGPAFKGIRWNFWCSLKF